MRPVKLDKGRGYLASPGGLLPEKSAEGETSNF